VTKLEPKKVIQVIIYSIVFTIGVNFFIVPGGFISIGLLGVIQMVYDVLLQMGINTSFGLLYLVINLPGLFIAYKLVGKKFTGYTLINVITVSIAAEVIPVMHLTDEVLMDVVFGGMIIGFATGMILRVGGSTGGFDPYGMFFYQKFGIDFNQFNLIANTSVVAIAAFLYGIEIALFTLLYVYIRNVSLENFFKKYHQLTIWIVGTNLEPVANYITSELLHGATKFQEVKGCHTNQDKEVLMTILNQYEYLKLKNKIKQLDDTAFIHATKVYELEGNFKRVKDTD